MAPPTQPADERVHRLEKQKETYLRTLRDTTEELEGKIHELSILGQLGQLFRSSTGLEDVATEALQMFLEASDAENASIMLYSRSTGELSILAAAGRSTQTIYYGPDGHPEAKFRLGEGLAGCCLEEGTALTAEDVGNEPRYLPDAGHVPIGSLACLPLLVQDEPLGVVNLSHPTRQALDLRRLPVWSILAGYLAIAVSHARLFQELKQTNQRLEERVRKRTRRLEETNHDLRAAQVEIARHNEDLQQRVRERTSELEDALNELRAQHASLEAANRIKDEFLNNINHELKTPLNAVIGYAGLLLTQTRGVLQDDQRADLELIEANGRHLQQILESILSLKDIEDGSVEVDRRPADLNELLQSAVHSVRPRASAKRLDLQFEPLDVPPVWLDTTLILRVVYNLLDNAVKFSARGKITVRSRVSQGEPGEPAGPAGRSYAVVEVEDQGRGIRDDDVARIFQKFQQAETPTKKHEAGSGIGLTIAKNLVELHGGRIWLRSRPGEGSTFAFSLPLGT